MKPLFNVQDFVLPRPNVHPGFEVDPSKPGMIMEIYEFAGQDRYLVCFPNGKETVFYEFELEAAEPPRG